MEKAVLLALAASFCTATASVCQRLGARSYERAGFDVWLVFRLARRPAWLLGLASMICGFVFQISALRFGPLALVQPVLALELLLVFGFMTVIGRRVRVERRDWLAAVAMSAGIGLFLGLAAPSGGRPHATASSWWLAGLVTLSIVLLALAVAFGPGHHPGTSRSRRARHAISQPFVFDTYSAQTAIRTQRHVRPCLNSGSPARRCTAPCRTPATSEPAPRLVSPSK
jgi:hypothetical protein